MRRQVGILASFFLVAACGTGGSPVPSTGAPTASTAASPGGSAAAGEEREVHFYNINAQTGQSAPFGTRSINGVNMLADEVNAAGGFEDACGNHYAVKITTGDMANDREQAVALLRAAAADPTVLGSIGSTPSTGYVAMVPVAGELKIPIMGTGAGAAIDPWNDYAFRINVVPAVATPVMMQTLEDKFDIKRLAVIYDQANDGNRTDAEIIRDIAAQVGYEVVAFEAFRTGDPDMRAQLTTIKAANPDWMSYNEPGEDLARVINQAFELGLGDLPKVTGFSQFDNPNAWDLTDGKTNGGYSWTAAVDVSSDLPDVQGFVQRYKAKFTEDATIYSLYGHDALALYIDAVTRSCTATDRGEFMQALRETKDWKGLATVVTFGPDSGENLNPAIKVTKTINRGQTEPVS